MQVLCIYISFETATKKNPTHRSTILVGRNIKVMAIHVLLTEMHIPWAHFIKKNWCFFYRYLEFQVNNCFPAQPCKENNLSVCRQMERWCKNCRRLLNNCKSGLAEASSTALLGKRWFLRRVILPVREELWEGQKKLRGRAQLHHNSSTFTNPVIHWHCLVTWVRAGAGGDSSQPHERPLIS